MNIETLEIETKILTQRALQSTNEIEAMFGLSRVPLCSGESEKTNYNEINSNLVKRNIALETMLLERNERIAELENLLKKEKSLRYLKECVK